MGTTQPKIRLPCSFLSSCLWSLSSQESLFYKTEHSTLEETGDPSRQVAAGRWEGPEWALLTALGSTAPCLCLILPQSWLKGTGGLGRAKEGLSVCEASTVPPTFRPSRCQAGVVTILRREEMTTRNGSERPSILSLFSNKTRTFSRMWVPGVCDPGHEQEVWSHNYFL